MKRRILALVATAGLVGSMAIGVTFVAVAVARENTAAALDRAAEEDLLTGRTTPRPTPTRSIPEEPLPQPTETYSGPLIAPDGFLEHTDEEIEAHLRERSPGGVSGAQLDIVIAQAIIVRDCMAEKGFLWDPIPFGSAGGRFSGWAGRGLTPEQEAAYRLALGGENDDVPYNWRDAGCDGRAVHETGQDNAH
jgi:hypothetical protein